MNLWYTPSGKPRRGILIKLEVIARRVVPNGNEQLGITEANGQFEELEK